jgi:HlyD family secretion protein
LSDPDPASPSSPSSAASAAGPSKSPASNVRTRRRIALLLIALLVGFVLFRTCFRERAVEVQVSSADYGPVEDLVVNSEAGTVKARSRARLGVEATGRVAAIPHRENDHVRRGDLLLRLDPTTERTRLQAAQRDVQVVTAALESARAAAELARQQYDRTRELHDRQIASRQQLDEARTRLETAEADVRAARARLRSAQSAVALARDQLTHLEIRAPFAGVIAHRYVEVGEQVTPGQPLLELVGEGDLYVSAPIDERDAGRLRQGLPARITVDAYPGVVWLSRLSRIAPVVEEERQQARTQEVEAALPPEPEGTWGAGEMPVPKPGMTADLEIVLDRKERVLRVPTPAVIDGRRVLLVEDGRAVSRDVVTGLRSWEWTEIRSGLEPGGHVITSLDRPGLKAGARVLIAGHGSGVDSTRGG